MKESAYASWKAKIFITPSMMQGFKFKLLPRTDGFSSHSTINAFITTQCTQAGSTWWIKGTYSALRPAM